MHIFPNVYHLVEADTAKMRVFPLHDHIDVEELKKDFTRFMVKDHVKSVKGTEFPKYFGNDITQEEFDRWMEVFYKYRGDLLQKYADLASPYYTVDYAELEDGSWKIIEADDGIVSGLSDGHDYEHYFRAMYHCFN